MKQHWTKKLKSDLLKAEQDKAVLYGILKRTPMKDLNAREVEVYMRVGMGVELENAVWSGASSVEISNGQ